MSNLPHRVEKLQKLVADTDRARERRDEALTKLVKAETKLRALEKQQERFRKSTKAIRKRLLIEAGAKSNPVTPPEPEPEAEPEPERAPALTTAAKAAALRSELRGERKKRN